MKIDYPTHELNNYLHDAGLEHLCVDEQVFARVSDLDDEAIKRLSAEVRQTLEAAQSEAPKVSQWDASAMALLMNDDGSQRSHEEQERFWRTISIVVFAAHALIRLGDIRTFPLFLDMATSMPGHPQELAREILRRYVDPAAALAPDELVAQARAWWQAQQQTLDQLALRAPGRES